MLPYLLRRILAMIPTLLGITMITFLIIDLAPGDPVATSMGVAGASTSEGGGGGKQEQAALAIKAKKQLLGILSKDHTVHSWDARAGAVAPEAGATRVPPLPLLARLGSLPDWPHALAAGPDASLWVGTESGGVVSIDAATGDERRSFEGHTKSVWTLALSPDGRTLATGDVDGTLRVWSASDGKALGGPPAFGRPLRDLVFVDGGAKLLSACEDGVLRVHDPATGRVVSEIKEHTGPVLALGVSPDGKTVWSGGFDRRLREWDAASMTLRRVVAMHMQSITDIAVAPDGRHVVTSCDDRLVRVFDVGAKPEGDVPAVECKGHFKEATAVAFSPDGRVVWSGSRDETVRSFDAATGVQTSQAPENSGRVHALVASADGATLWSASESWTKTPVWKRYAKWLKNTVTLDFGVSFIDERRVMDKVLDALPITLGLNVLTIFLIYLIAVPLGVRAAVKRGSLFDASSSIVLFALASMPSFWVGTLLITTFSSERHWNVLPCAGLESIEAEHFSYIPWMRDRGLHLVLPLIVLTYGGFSGLSQYVRSSMLDTIAQDYVRTARAKGLSERVVVYKHALRNSLITVVTLLGTMLPALIGGSVIVEQIFSIQGMGWLGFEAISARDYPVVMAITTFGAVLTLFGMLLSDVLYTIVDPRIAHS